MSTGVCPMCAAALQPMVRVRDEEVRLCQGCGSGVLWPRPSQAALSALHGSPDYFGHDYFAARRALQGGVMTEFSGVLEQLAVHHGGGAAPRLLDVGCDTGAFLEVAARRYGFEVCGVDVSPLAVDAVREKGLEAHEGTLEEAALPKGSFDVVTALDVVEHVEDPGSLLRAVARVLKPGGVAFLTTPNLDSWTFQVGCLAGVAGGFGQAVVDRLFPPFHVHYFSTPAMRLLAEQAGLTIVRIRHVPLAVESIGVDSDVMRLGLRGLSVLERLTGAGALKEITLRKGRSVG